MKNLLTNKNIVKSQPLESHNSPFEIPAGSHLRSPEISTDNAAMAAAAALLMI